MTRVARTTVLTLGTAVLAGAVVGLTFLSVASGSSGEPAAIFLSRKGAAVLLAGGWVWLRHALRWRTDWGRRVLLAVTWVVACQLLALLWSWAPGGDTVIELALLLLAGAALYGVAPRLLLPGILAASLVLIPGYSYVGVVLILVGLAAAPSRLGAYTRELFPRRVGGPS